MGLIKYVKEEIAVIRERDPAIKSNMEVFLYPSFKVILSYRVAQDVYKRQILDGARVTFGDNVFIAPNCVFSTAGHAIDSAQRNQGLEIALPITVGDSVWIGANVSVLPGVTIGSNTIIGAGSVVNKDIPDGVIAAGNPCKVIRRITEEDRKKYPVFGGDEGRCGVLK